MIHVFIFLFIFAGLSLSAKAQLSSDSIKIELRPNVFTPNGDLLNDQFIISSNQEVTRCDIYNRWGIEIFSFYGIGGWDGRLLSGENAAEGVYYYQAVLSNGDKIKGSLHLFR